MPCQSNTTTEAREVGSQQMTAPILVEKTTPITWIKLNRPQVHNSLNSELLRMLHQTILDLANDKETRVVVITGAGNKAFCSGADLAERKTMTEGQVLEYLGLIQSTFRAIEELPKPVIAALNGSAYGGGTELALACDLRMMTEDALLRLTEVKLGIIPGAGGTQRLSRLIGKSRAKEIVLTARPLPAAEAHQVGLVHKIVPAQKDKDTPWHTDLMEQAKAWATEIAAAAPLSLAAAKYAIDKGFDCDLEAGLAIETKAYLRLLNTKDRKEGLAAFAEKRDPVYCGE